METTKVRNLVATALFASLWLLIVALATNPLLLIAIWVTIANQIASVGWVGWFA